MGLIERLNEMSHTAVFVGESHAGSTSPLHKVPLHKVLYGSIYKHHCWHEDTFALGD